MSTLDPMDLIFEPFPSERPKGMQVPDFTGGIKITHVPTGSSVVCCAGRGQGKNRTTALITLEFLLMESEWTK
jgi:protein subunit release factor A